MVMSSVRNMRIVTKVGLALALLLALGVAAGSVAFRSLGDAAALSEELSQRIFEVSDMRQLSLAVESADSATHRYLITLDPQWRERASADAITATSLLDSLAEDATIHPEDEEFYRAIRSWLANTVGPSLAAADAVAAGTADRGTLEPAIAMMESPEDHLPWRDALTEHIAVAHAQGIRDVLAAQLQQDLTNARVVLAGSVATLIVLGVLILWLLSRGLGRRFAALEADVSRIELGQLDQPIESTVRDELGHLASGIENMRRSLLASRTTTAEFAERQQTLLDVGQVMSEGGSSRADDIHGTRTADERVLALLATYCEAPQAVLYVRADADSATFTRAATFGIADGHLPQSTLIARQGLLGDVAVDQEPRFVTMPSTFELASAVETALGSGQATQVALVPCVAHGTTLALLEAASFQEFTDAQRSLLADAGNLIGLHLTVRAARRRTEQLLQEARAQSEELMAQAEELQSQSEELEAQSIELREANVSLEENAAVMEEQQGLLTARNDELRAIHEELLRRTEIADQASAYKSAFLAKMSHELRTPLNSIMILSERLSANADSTLTDKQIQFAQTIHECGQDLLALINDVLDLSKVESGRIEIHNEECRIRDLAEALEHQFAPLAAHKGLGLVVTVSPRTPETFIGDRLRVEQVMRNLLSNAVKFTEAGTVTLTVDAVDDMLTTLVTDTGVGISAEHLDAVFEPFKQVGDHRSATAAGTGLGLSISRELARHMGGDLTVVSTPGTGSTFTFTVPLVGHDPEPTDTAAASALGTSPAQAISSPSGGVPSTPRHVRAEGEAPTQDEELSPEESDRPVLLVIEDNPSFADIIADEGRRQGFRPVIAGSGRQALAALSDRTPDAITLDLGLPDMDGWVLLDRIRHDVGTRHTPVQIISASASAQRALGVSGKLMKPVAAATLASALRNLVAALDDHPRSVLVVDAQATRSAAVAEAMAGAQIRSVAGPDAARVELEEATFDLIVLDMSASPDDGLALLREWRDQPETAHTPVIVFHDPTATGEQIDQAALLANALIANDDAAHARLLDETARFLRRIGGEESTERTDAVSSLYRSDSALAGRVILIVDDDPRNVFSLATILEQHDVTILDAEDGQAALEVLEQRPDVDLVLMDVMMPRMDGLEATARIRANPSTADLPVITVTALAMPEDRQRCLAAGASDYISKPVDATQLVSLIRVWLRARPT